MSNTLSAARYIMIILISSYMTSCAWVYWLSLGFSWISNKSALGNRGKNILKKIITFSSKVVANPSFPWQHSSRNWGNSFISPLLMMAYFIILNNPLSRNPPVNSLHAFYLVFMIILPFSSTALQ